MLQEQPCFTEDVIVTRPFLRGWLVTVRWLVKVV